MLKISSVYQFKSNDSNQKREVYFLLNDKKRDFIKYIKCMHYEFMGTVALKRLRTTNVNKEKMGWG